jgi:hypothetical protein
VHGVHVMGLTGSAWCMLGVYIFCGVVVLLLAGPTRHTKWKERDKAHGLLSPVLDSHG